MDLGGRGMVYCRGYDNYTYRRLQSVETPSMRTNGGGGAVLVAARSWSVFQSFLVVCCVLLLSPPIHVGLFVVWFMRCVTFDTRPIWGLRPQKLCQICGDLGCYPPRQCEGSTLALAPPRVDKQGGDRVQHIIDPRRGTTANTNRRQK